MERHKTTYIDFPIPFDRPEDCYRAETLVKRVTSLGINVENIFADTGLKHRLLSEYGYKWLRVGPGKNFLPLPICKPERVGEVFKERYYTCLKKLADLDKIHETDERERRN